MRIRWLVLATSILAVARPAVSQDASRLHSAKTFRCEFAVGVSTRMNGDKPLPKLNKDKLELVFDQLDMEKGTGRLIGNIGGADVTVLSSVEALSIIERTMSGSLQVTVIYLSQLPDGTFKAVHSRHTTMLGGVPMPSQFYGTCQALL